jgi:hypothetical protein
MLAVFTAYILPEGLYTIWFVSYSACILVILTIVSNCSRSGWVNLALSTLVTGFEIYCLLSGQG